MVRAVVRLAADPVMFESVYASVLRDDEYTSAARVVIAGVAIAGRIVDVAVEPVSICGWNMSIVKSTAVLAAHPDIFNPSVAQPLVLTPADGTIVCVNRVSAPVSAVTPGAELLSIKDPPFVNVRIRGLKFVREGKVPPARRTNTVPVIGVPATAPYTFRSSNSRVSFPGDPLVVP